MSHSIVFTAMERPVRAPDDGGDTVAFQMVKYRMPFFSVEVSNQLDSRILKDGRQFVIDGDGFFPAGTEITDFIKH